MANELLEFPGGILGVALNLEDREIGAVVLGNFDEIAQGQEVRRTGEVLSVPVGDGFLGRVVNPLGQPIDGLGDIESEGTRALELQAPSVLERQPVEEPMQTGIKAIDAMTPIGRGQRQLIIGDRKTGKTAVCIDAILNQKANWRRTARGSTPPPSPPPPLTRPASSGSRRSPVRPSGSTGCTTVRTSWSCSTTCPSRPTRTARSRCCSVAPRVARRTPATSSTCTPACSSGAPSSRTRWAVGR